MPVMSMPAVTSERESYKTSSSVCPRSCLIMFGLFCLSPAAMEELVAELRVFLELLDREYLSAAVREKKLLISNILHKVLSAKGAVFYYLHTYTLGHYRICASSYQWSYTHCFGMTTPPCTKHKPHKDLVWRLRLKWKISTPLNTFKVTCLILMKCLISITPQ